MGSDETCKDDTSGLTLGTHSEAECNFYHNITPENLIGCPNSKSQAVYSNYGP